MEQLARAWRAGRVAHAYLFYGPEGVGKFKVAQALAQMLNCSRRQEFGCGECEDCRLVARLAHPDVRLLASEAELARRGIAPEPDGSSGKKKKARAPSTQIKVEQLDELAGMFRHKPYRGRWKVLLVDDAHLMNQHAQNRFLKTLEEPSSSTCMVLVTHRPEALLPTVRSRCQSLCFGALAQHEVAKLMEERHGIDGEAAARIAGLSHGSCAAAMRLLDSGILELRRRLVELCRELKTAGLEKMLAWAEELSGDREESKEIVELLEWLLRDVALAASGVDVGLMGDPALAADVHELAERIGIDMVLEWMDRVRLCRQQLERNANPRMAFEGLLWGLRTA